MLWGQPLGQVLADLGASPNFASTAELNWIHRQTTDANIYFIANPSNTLRDAVCTFRVADKQPELWDPETGQRRDLPQFARTADGRMSCALRFEPAQSYFLVFRRPTIKPLAKANFPLWKEIAEVTGPWQLSFPPNWGAPATLTLTNLLSWSEQLDDGVRHFSGVATYTVTFDLPATLLANRSSPTILDLGAVLVMARIKVNGQSCGVAWKPPFRVNVTQALRPGVNIVEIAVANLWPNRLIGDAALPEAKRFTWTTWNPYQNDSPLLPSGLLGRVKLLSATE